MSCLSFSARLLWRAALISLLAGGAGADAPVLPAALQDSDFHYPREAGSVLFELGRDLFFDPILSGNRNISCGTCHDPGRGTGDDRALPIGEGGEGFGRDRTAGEGVSMRVPRNAQPLYNLGAKAYTNLFHDGRVELLADGGFRSPAGRHLPEGLDNALAVQALFPLLSPAEMAGRNGENPVATASAQDRLTEAWALLAGRVATLPGYADRFVAGHDDIDSADDISIRHIANALARFQAQAFRADDSRFDTVLRAGSDASLSASERRGLRLFYGRAGCADCHSGPLLTDHQFHAIAMPQIGPGKGHGHDASFRRTQGFADRLEDEGRHAVSFSAEDLFKFRTPSLRNVALTGPWGHSGAYQRLEDVVRHHLDPVARLDRYRLDAETLPPLSAIIRPGAKGSALAYRVIEGPRAADYRHSDGWVQQSASLRNRIARANVLAPVALDDGAVADIVAFLETLTDENSRDQSALIPGTVPSGLKPQPEALAAR